MTAQQFAIILVLFIGIVVVSKYLNALDKYKKDRYKRKKRRYN